MSITTSFQQLTNELKLLEAAAAKDIAAAVDEKIFLAPLMYPSLNEA